jgi:MSHA biogenesis protein MshJ
MKLNSENIQAWYLARTKRERLLFLLVCLVIVYMFWFLVFSRPLNIKQKEILNQIQAAQTKLETVLQQKNVILSIANDPRYSQQIREQKQLQGQSKSAEQNLEKLKSMVVPLSQLTRLTKDLLSQSEGIQLLDLKKLDSKAWAPEGVETNWMPNYKKIYKQTYQLEFHSDYFSAIRYLGRLEKLPWRLYWDSLEYKVDQYPNANIVIRFYLLVNQDV